MASGTVERRKGLARHAVRVREVARPSESLVLLSLDRPKGYEFEAGQFAYVFVPESDHKRPYSIASPPHDTDRVDLCVKRIEGGPASSYLYGLGPGARVEISRALGGFRFRTPPAVPVALLSTGTGVAPFRAMVRQLAHDGDARDVWLFVGSRERKNLPYHDEFVELAARVPSFRYVPVLSGNPIYWDGDRGWIQEAFLRRFPHPAELHVYVCGIKRMVDDVRLLLRERGLPHEAVHLERYV